MTLNEPQCFVGLGLQTGYHAPGDRLRFGEVLLAAPHVLLAHGRAVKVIRAVRERYPGLIICGGIDKREIAKGGEAIDRELEAKLPFMFRRGGYLPSMDHHVPPEVSYDNFCYYVKKTQDLFTKWGRA